MADQILVGAILIGIVIGGGIGMWVQYADLNRYRRGADLIDIGSGFFVGALLGGTATGVPGLLFRMGVFALTGQ